jgi:hypothetical protein
MYFCVDKRPAALLQRKKSLSWLDGTSQDTVSTTGWTLQTTGALSGWKVGDTLASSYNMYIATGSRPAMMMVEQGIVPSTIL